MTRKEWYEMNHDIRYEHWAQRQRCVKRREFRRAVKAMFVNRAIRAIRDANAKMFESILRITK